MRSLRSLVASTGLSLLLVACGSSANENANGGDIVAPVMQAAPPAVGTAEPELASTDLLVVAKRSAGWAHLSPTEQSTLTALLTGTANPWSLAAIPIARTGVFDAHWSKTSADQQAAFFRALWTNDKVRPLQISFLRLAGSKTPKPFTLADPVSIGSQDFPGGPADAMRWDMTIEGRVVGIYGPSGPAIDGALPSPTAIATIIASAPAAPRGQVKNVVLDPYRDPKDADYDKKFGTMGFRAFMEGSATGRVMVYPQVRDRPDTVDVLVHESGHVWSFRDLDDAAWTAWDAAATLDGHFVSNYASTFDTEDIAETWAVYACLEAGSRTYNEVSAMFPARFAFVKSHGPH